MHTHKHDRITGQQNWCDTQQISTELSYICSPATNNQCKVAHSRSVSVLSQNAKRLPAPWNGFLPCRKYSNLCRKHSRVGFSVECVLCVRKRFLFVSSFSFFFFFFLLFFFVVVVVCLFSVRAKCPEYHYSGKWIWHIQVIHCRLREVNDLNFNNWNNKTWWNQLIVTLFSTLSYTPELRLCRYIVSV